MKKNLPIALLCALAYNSKAQNIFPLPSGWVGIGITTPTYPLTLNNSAGETGILTINNGTSIYLAHGGWGMPAGKFGIGNGSVPTFVVNAVANGGASVGNVGIGTTDPKLPFSIVVPNAKTTETGNMVSFFSTNDSSTPFGLRTMLYGAAAIGNRYVTLQTTDYSILDGGNIVLQPASGNVGIGTSLPMSLFQVDGGCTKANIGDASGIGLNYGTSYLGFNAARNSGSWTLHADGHDNGGGMMYANIHGDLYFAPIASTGTTDQTLSDASIRSKIALRVEHDGTTYAKKVIVELTGWPDYVFKPTYNLKPLSEVKTYIDQNHHLPEMPSEKDVADKGIDLGEIVKLQTKKIEELTLYMIEKDRQVQKEHETNQSQQTQIDELKKLIKKK